MLKIMFIVNFRMVVKNKKNNSCENLFKYLLILFLLRKDNENYIVKGKDFCREI